MKITLITACYNSEEFIADTLCSVDAQTWPEIEHIIVDGASRDATLEIVSKFKQSWRYVISEKDNGVYDAMNKGIKSATGEVVAFLNSDDLYASPQVLERVAAVFEDATIDGCYGDLCYVKQDNVQAMVRYWRSSPHQQGQFAKGWVPPHPSLFLRRRVFQRFGMFDLQYTIAADFELMARLLEVHRIKTVYVPELFVKMRLGGTSNRSIGNIFQQNREIWRALAVHKLQASLFTFAVGKVISRGRQFFMGPV